MSRRTSGRAAARNKSYNIDVFEGYDLEDNISGRSPIRHSRDSDSAEEFNVETEAADGAEDDEEGDDSDAYDEDEGEDGDSDAGERDLDDAMSIAGDAAPSVEIKPKPANGCYPRPKRPYVLPEDRLYSRGLPENITRKSGKYEKRLFLFGSSVKEFEAIEKTCYKWDGQDSLPLRRKPQDHVSENYEDSFWQGDEARQHEFETSWKWYFEHGGKEPLQKRQKFTKMSTEEGRARVNTSTVPERSFLAGPIKTLKLYKLPVGEFVSLKQIWEQPPKTDEAKPPKYRPEDKAGFILNLGANVKCVEWAPNQPGSSQYLAASTWPERRVPKRTAPAYDPQKPHPSQVQIWEFAATDMGALDQGVAPVLKHVLCTEWGDIRALKWCPAAYNPSSKTKRSIGLLAGIWGDGGLRVIDLMDQPQGLTKYTRIEKAAFEAHPPGTIFTRVTWMSGSRIAAGCSNGCIAIFDLDKCASSDFPRPTSFTSVATGFILSMTSCYPSRQNILLTTSTDGYPRMTDLNQPDPSSAMATIQAPRSRTTQDIIAWDDFCQTAVVMDDNFALKGLPLRRFFTTVALGRAKSVGTSIATSPCHPFVLMGTAHGEVIGLNPMRRIIQPKVLPLLQSWFSHEWRRATPAEAAGEDEKGVGPWGLSRFTEGYVIEQGRRTYGEGSMQNSEDKEHGVHIHTLFEHETGVASLAWNQNRECGSWAAAGLVCGLLRVEDLSAA